jgi:cytochrome c-type biogenesis protein CcmH/NrfF
LTTIGKRELLGGLDFDDYGIIDNKIHCVACHLNLVLKDRNTDLARNLVSSAMELDGQRP